MSRKRLPSDSSLRRGGSPGPSGYGAGTTWSGGTMYADAFGAKRGPSPAQLLEGYKQISFACEEIVVGAMARLPLRLYAGTGGGKPRPSKASGPRSLTRDEFARLRSLSYIRSMLHDVDDASEITEYPFLSTLNAPAVDPETGLSYFDRPSWLMSLVRWVDLCGFSALMPQNDNGASFSDLVAAEVLPTHLWPLQAQYVWPIRKTNSAMIQQFKYFQDLYEPRDIVWIRLRPSPRDPYGAGYAALQAAWQYVQLEDKSISMWDQLIGSGARPNLIASPEDPNVAPGDDERRRFEGEMNTYQAKGRGGRFLATTGGWKFTPVNYQGFDLGEMEVDKYLKECIANCFGVPVALLSTQTNMANLQASRTQLAEQAVEPRCQMLASALTAIVQKYDDRLFFAFDESVPEDEERKAKIVDMRLKNQSITVNEARLDTPFEPVPWGDEPWMPSSLVQPSMAVEKHDAGLAAADAGAKATANKPPSGGGSTSPPTNEPSKAERAVLRRADRVLRKIEKDLKS